MEVHFYEKPGCINNTKQKKLLEEKGHTVLSYDLIKWNWTVDTLQPFLQERPLDEWFNLSAPRIKSGEVDTTKFTKESALEAMVADHFLIKRPLLRVNGHCACGFDSQLAQELLQETNVESLLNCPKMSKNESCE